ncbi:MAG: N-acetylmuramoyl-L-alanine amidase [Phycisphaerales bacterium]|nr:N-acetylmuramoyl-L-alanine amidase [Phycisphaerales bacterium]
MPRTKAKKAKPVSPRTKVVWGALLGAMTIGAGSLLLLDGASMPRFRGTGLPALAATNRAGSMEAALVTRAPLAKDQWRAIVVHHSGGPHGTPEALDEAARRDGLRGLGHHFVIGNGSGMRDGELYLGYRWLDQLPGAHAFGDQAEWLDRHAISICMVGNGDRRGFTKAQMTRLAQLTRTLARELDIPADRIYLQSDLAGVSDPGLHFADAAFRESLADLR